MRPLLPALVLAAALAVGPALPDAHAQVTVNPGALDLLPARPTPARPAARPVHPSPPRATPAARRAAPGRPGNPPTPAAPAAGPAAAAAAPPKPTLPTIAPAVAALPPPAPVPPPRATPAPIVPVLADAPGTATPRPGGVRVTFGKDSESLNPGTEAALRALADTLKPADTTTVNIYAYATGSPDDPSTSRRLALSRALAARAVLITQGIASTRIYPRALGQVGGETDPDRVDVVAGPPGPPATASPAIAPPATAPPATAPPATAPPATARPLAQTGQPAATAPR